MSKKEKVIVGTLVIVVIVGLFFLFMNGNVWNRGFDFKIYFFEAGKADAILITKNEYAMMIDTGEENLGDDILEYFRKNGISKLDYLVITHFDKDHVGSASTVIDNFEIGEVITSNVPKESEYYDNYIASLEAKNMTPTIVSGDYELEFSDLKIVVNGPDTIYDNNESNNSSLIVSIEDGQNAFLFMGDAENARIKDFIAQNKREYDFLKVPYHGHYLKRLEELLKDRGFSYAVITSSDREKEDEETLKILEKYDIEYYLTREGNITVLSNGQTISVRQ